MSRASTLATLPTSMMELKLSISKNHGATRDEQFTLLQSCSNDNAVENLLRWLCGPTVGMSIADVICEIKCQPDTAQPRNLAIQIARRQAGGQ